MGCWPTARPASSAIWLSAGLAWGIAYLARTINLLTLPVYLVGLIMVLHNQAMRRGQRFALSGAGLRYALASYWRPRYQLHDSGCGGGSALALLELGALRPHL